MSADRCLSAVEEFHRAFECPVPCEPGLPCEDVQAELFHFAAKLKSIGREMKTASARAGGSNLLIRIQLMAEEVGELAQAMAERDLPAVVRELSDVAYVTDGTWLALGMRDLKEPAVMEVHRANMSKLDDDGNPIKDPSGRVVKGPNFQPPDMVSVLATHSPSAGLSAKRNPEGE